MSAQCASNSRLHVKNPLCSQPMTNQPLDPSMSIAITHDHKVAIKEYDKFEHTNATLKLSFKDAAVEGEFLLYRHANRWMPVVGISCILIASIVAFFAVGKQRSFVESLFVFVPCIVWVCSIIIMVAMKLQLDSMPPMALIKYDDGNAGAQPEDPLPKITNASSAQAIRNAWIHEIGVLLCITGHVPMLLWTYWMKGQCHNIPEGFDRRNLCVHGFYWDGLTLMYYPMCFVLFPTSTAKYAALFSIFLGLYFGLRFLPDYSVEVLYSHLFSDALLNGGAAIGSIIAAFFSERHLRTKFVEVSMVHRMSINASELRRETLRLRTAQFPGEVVDTARFHEHELRWYSHGGAVCVMGIHHFYDWASVRGPLDAALLLQQFVAAADFICASVALELKQNRQATASHSPHRLCRGQVLGDEFVTYCGPLMHAALKPHDDCPSALTAIIESVQGLLLLTSRFQKAVTELSLFAGVGYDSNPALCPPGHVEGRGRKHLLSLICGISEGSCVAIMSAETSGLVFVGPAVRDACSCLHRTKQIATIPGHPQLIVATNERLGTMLQCHNAARLETTSRCPEQHKLLVAKVTALTAHALRPAVDERDALDGHNITEAQSMLPSQHDGAQSLAPLLVNEERTTEIQVIMLANSNNDLDLEGQCDGVPMTECNDNDNGGPSSSEVTSYLADRSPTSGVDEHNDGNAEANMSHSTVPLSHNVLSSNVASMMRLIGVIPCMPQSLWLGAVFESEATERTYSAFRDAEYGGPRRSIFSFSCLSAFSLACMAICCVDETRLSMWLFATSSIVSVAGVLLAFMSCFPRLQWVACTLTAAYVVLFVAGVFTAPRGTEVGNSRIPWIFVVCLLQLRPVISRPLVMWASELAVCVTFAIEAFFFPNATAVGLNVASYVVVYLSLAVAFLQMRVQSDLTVRKEFVIGARINLLSDALQQYHDMLAAAVAEVAPEGVAAELRNRLRAKATSKVIKGEINFLPFRSTQLTTTADDVELLVIRVSFPRLKNNHHGHSLCDDVKMTFECNDHIEALICGLMHSEPLCKSIDRCKLVPGDVMAFTSRSGDFGDCEERAANLFLAAPLILNALECASLPGGPLPLRSCRDETPLMKVAYGALFVSGPVVGTLVGSSGASFEYCGAALQLALEYVRFVLPDYCCFATSRFLMRCRTGLEHKVRTDSERSVATMTDSANGLSEELVTRGGCVLASVAKASNPFRVRGGQRVFLHAIVLPPRELKSMKNFAMTSGSSTR